jgi:hypothetical protein
MTLPAFRADGWLPEGHHQTTWAEVAERFGGTPRSRRNRLLRLLFEWRDSLRKKSMGGLLILDGSFISRKAEPGDFDCLFVYDAATAKVIEEDEQALDLLSYERCKARGYGDIFALSEAAVREYPKFCHLDMFDADKVTKAFKGVVEIKI